MQAGARKALNEVLGAEDRPHAERAIQAFASDYGTKWPKAVAKVVDDREVLLAFFDYPAEHWQHLRTTNPIVISGPGPVRRYDHVVLVVDMAKKQRRGRLCPGVLALAAARSLGHRRLVDWLEIRRPAHRFGACKRSCCTSWKRAASLQITIESTFSLVRARTRVTKGPGSTDAGLAMVFKLLEGAEGRWRKVNGPQLVALVRAGARFDKGKLVERPKEDTQADNGTEVAA